MSEVPPRYDPRIVPAHQRQIVDALRQILAQVDRIAEPPFENVDGLKQLYERAEIAERIADFLREVIDYLVDDRPVVSGGLNAQNSDEDPTQKTPSRPNDLLRRMMSRRAPMAPDSSSSFEELLDAAVQDDRERDGGE